MGVHGLIQSIISKRREEKLSLQVTNTLLMGVAAFTILMLALLVFASALRVFARAFTLVASVMPALVMLVAMWLSLDEDHEVLASLANSMNPALISIWPLTRKLLFYIILDERLLCVFIVEKYSLRRFKCRFAGWICAFNFCALDTSDAVIVVVDSCLEDIMEMNLNLTASITLKFQNIWLRIKTDLKLLTSWCLGKYKNSITVGPLLRVSLNLYLIALEVIFEIAFRKQSSLGGILGGSKISEGAEDISGPRSARLILMVVGDGALDVEEGLWAFVISHNVD